MIVSLSSPLEISSRSSLSILFLAFQMRYKHLEIQSFDSVEFKLFRCAIFFERQTFVAKK